MKTTILEELELPEDRKAALRREALRRGVPVARLISEFLIEKSTQIIAAASPSSSASSQAAA
jgi:hypothetical protein